MNGHNPNQRTPNADDLLRQINQKLHSNSDEMKQTLGSDTVNKMMNNINHVNKQQLQNILNDEEATKRLLSSPQAQALLKKLQGNQNKQK